MSKFVNKQYRRVLAITTEKRLVASFDGLCEYDAGVIHGYEQALEQLLTFVATLPKDGKTITGKKLVKKFLKQQASSDPDEVAPVGEAGGHD